MLRAIAEANGVELASNQATQMADQLAAALSDASHLRASVAACTPAAQAALAELLRAGGRSPRPAFERAHGGIRPAGPGKLERERPHLAPANPAEELWYRGLLYPAMVETSDGLVEFLHVPAELAKRLPPPPPAATPFPPPALAALPVAPPVTDLLLHDACSLLCLVQAGLGALSDSADLFSWQSKALYEYSQLSLQPLEDPASIVDTGPGSPAALALALAVDLGWLRARGRWLALVPGGVRAWLEAARADQRRYLLDAWAASALWNDLCRTPALSCEQTGSWVNDPVGTRQRLLPLLASLQPRAWYDLPSLVAAIKARAPDFQRPDGNYDTWYIRLRSAPAFLRGFEHWEQVEGELLRFMLTGPLGWMGATVLASDEASRPASVSLTAPGHAWLHGEPPPPATPGCTASRPRRRKSLRCWWCSLTSPSWPAIALRCWTASAWRASPPGSRSRGRPAGPPSFIASPRPVCIARRSRASTPAACWISCGRALSVRCRPTWSMRWSDGWERHTTANEEQRMGHSEWGRRDTTANGAQQMGEGGQQALSHSLCPIRCGIAVVSPLPHIWTFPPAVG